MDGVFLRGNPLTVIDQKPGTMTTNTESLKPLAWVLLVFTIFLVGMFSLAFGFTSLLMVLIRGIMGDSPVRVDQILWVGAVIVLPALLLLPFYFAAATRHLSAFCGTLGWIASSFYHAGMTGWLVAYMPATVQSSQTLIPVPVALFTGAAFLASVYILIRGSSRPAGNPEIQP